MSRTAWTKNDVRFLKSMRIRADEPPALPPRYLAVPGVEGWWHVIDLDRGRKRIRHFAPYEGDAQKSAETVASNLNRSDVAK